MSSLDAGGNAHFLETDFSDSIS